MNSVVCIGNTTPSPGINIDGSSSSFRFAHDRTNFGELHGLQTLTGSASGDENFLELVGHRSLEDIDLIPNEVAGESMISETLSDESRQPHPDPRRGGDDLTALMNERQRFVALSSIRPDERLLSRSGRRAVTAYGTERLKERMEEYLEEGLARILRQNTQGITTEASKFQPFFDPNREANVSVGTQSALFKVPMVWNIHPTVRNSKTKFEFSTDNGACLLLNKRNAMEFLQLVESFDKKNSTRLVSCNTYYQVYTMDSRESRVVKGDAVFSLIEDIAGVAMKQGENLQVDVRMFSKKKNGNGPASHQGIDYHFMRRKESPKFSKRSHYLVKRLFRRLKRYRMKRLIRQQVQITIKKRNVNFRD